MNKDSKIYVAGHRGLVGSAIMRRLKQEGYQNILVRTSKELDLRRQSEVEHFFAEKKPDYVFLAAAKVGGILANSTYKADFIYDNMQIASNVIHAAYKTKVIKLMNLGSSCIYPKHAPQPMKEEYLLTGPLEPTNEPYAIAKISAIKLCRYFNEQYGTNFISAMPTNLYGPYDNFDLETSHVLPAIMRKVHNAKKAGEDEVVLWGDGSPKREFLYSEDLAEALLYLMHNVNADQVVEHINVGVGQDISIKELAELIADEVGYNGKFLWDTSKPNGTPRKLLDVSLINSLGWKAETKLREGIRNTYQWFCDNY